MDGRAKTKDLTGDLARYGKPHESVLIRYSSGGHKRKLRESQGLTTHDKNVHFDCPSQIELGRRMAEGMLKQEKPD